MNQEHDSTPRPEDDEFFLLTKELGLPWEKYTLLAREQSRVVYARTVHQEYQESDFEERVKKKTILLDDDFMGEKQPARFKEARVDWDNLAPNTFFLTQALGLKERHQVVARERGSVVCARTEYHEYEDIKFQNVVTDIDIPEDIFSSTQRHLYIQCLHEAQSAWTDRKFLAAGNTFVYMPDDLVGVSPNFLLAMDAEIPESGTYDMKKCYFVEVIGKVPDLVIDVVMNKKIEEEEEKKKRYAQMGITYYVLQDPYHYLFPEKFRVYKLTPEGVYAPYEEKFNYFPELNLGLQAWSGTFYGVKRNYLRWCTKDGRLLETGSEAAAHEAQARKELERELAAMRAQLEALGLRAPKDTPPEQ